MTTINAIPTNQQEEAVSTTTTTTAYGIVAETETNNRTKRARWAKNLADNFGISKVTLGDVTISKREGVHYSYNGAQVVFQPVLSKLANEAGATWYITAAWLNSELEIIAAELVHLNGGEFYLWERHQHASVMPAWLTTNNGYAQRGYDVASSINCTFCDGDQAGFFREAEAKRVKADAERAAHENRVAQAYEAANDGKRYHYEYILSRAPEATATRDESRASIKSALAGVEAAMVAELWEWVKASLGKLRCETTICDRYGDQYDFVTTSEVAYVIMTRWVEDGFGDVERGIRNAVAREFIRRHLS